MLYPFEFRRYCRSFKSALQTRYGRWAVRDGILLKFTSKSGQVGWGEIAPIAWFGSESLAAVLDFCHSLPTAITEETIAQIPSSLPACQFGFESALEWLTQPQPDPILLTCSRLLAADSALEQWQSYWQQGDRTFKLKIGVAPFQSEMQQVEQLLQSLPPGSQLRLDANGGLNWETACQWLQLCDRLRSPHHGTVEFLEQPLPSDQFDAMLRLSHQYATAIALDESVATLEQLIACCQRGWRGVVVMKPAIAGSPAKLRHVCQTYHPDLVWSSAFETAVARTYITSRLIPSIAESDRAIGFGVQHWFADSLSDQDNFEQLWQSL